MPQIAGMVNSAVARADPAPTDPKLAREAAARLFRSVRAGRSWLRERSTAGQGSACVAMKPGNGDPPVFMIPGAPGSILQLAPIAGAMAGPMPVHAIRPRGIEAGETPCGTVPEMAAFAIAAMKSVRPAGPYYLVGYSAGGLVALEMAQRLTAAGERVPLLVLLDTNPSRAVWPLVCHAEILGRQALRAIWALCRRGPATLARRLRSLSGYLAASGVSGLKPLPLVPEGVGAASQRVHEASFNAGEAYRPSRYRGKVLIVRPREIPDLEPRRPAQVWRRYLADFEVRRVPGTHLGLVDDGAAAVAEAIGDCLNRCGDSQE